ncbi:hypothetical protein MJO28_012956 [Puccinia striiformis f. sp. tritici]|uniref:Uncharacterized protein n=1 Tax=Puccinia striiformis f. sp. tritici TaxID=168172 RepID=A0ACC0DX62_9BASI|nr:hypothetical protein MJO28_012956 [Puccinia striiformis f. sp. tritici]
MASQHFGYVGSSTKPPILTDRGKITQQGSSKGNGSLKSGFMWSTPATRWIEEPSWWESTTMRPH